MFMAPINAGESSVLLLRPLGADPQVPRPDTREIAAVICRHLNGRRPDMTAAPTSERT